MKKSIKNMYSKKFSKKFSQNFFQNNLFLEIPLPIHLIFENKIESKKIAELKFNKISLEG